MTTKLDRPLKREVGIAGVLYTVTLGPEGLKLVQKGHRKGHEITWQRVIAESAEASETLSRPPEASSEQSTSDS